MGPAGNTDMQIRREIAKHLYRHFKNEVMHVLAKNGFDRSDKKTAGVRPSWAWDIKASSRVRMIYGCKGPQDGLAVWCVRDPIYEGAMPRIYRTSKKV